MLVTIKDKLFKDIHSYCSINGLDVETYINDMLKKSFMIEKYGNKPGISVSKKETEPINEPKKEPISEPIKKETVEKPKTKPIQIVQFREEDIVEHEEPVEPVKEKHRKLTKK
jgi:hypothetical protein